MKEKRKKEALALRCISQIIDIMYPDPDYEWDSDTIADVADVLNVFGFVPGGEEEE